VSKKKGRKSEGGEAINRSFTEILLNRRLHVTLTDDIHAGFSQLATKIEDLGGEMSPDLETDSETQPDSAHANPLNSSISNDTPHPARSLSGTAS